MNIGLTALDIAAIGVKPGTGARRIEVSDLREFVRASREGVAA